MPFKDRTGPQGMGPMTGHGAGLCGDVLRGGPGMRHGRSFRRGAGRFHSGQEMGRGFGFVNPGPVTRDIPASEIDTLKTEARAMSERLDAIRQRIDELGEHD